MSMAAPNHRDSYQDPFEEARRRADENIAAGPRPRPNGSRGCAGCSMTVFRSSAPGLSLTSGAATVRHK
jgi:hypothetical protein